MLAHSQIQATELQGFARIHPPAIFPILIEFNFTGDASPKRYERRYGRGGWRGTELSVPLQPPLPRYRANNTVYDDDATYGIITAVMYFQSGLLLTRAS